VSDALWEARNTFRPPAGDRLARLDLASPYLLSGLGCCALCGGAVIAMSRHHGRRRGFFYGCAYNSKRGPAICRNNLHMPQAVLEHAVVDTVANMLDAAVLGASVDRAMELIEERREATRQRRSAFQEELRTVRTQEARLVDAVKHGHELDALVASLRAVQDRRRMLEQNLATLDTDTVPGAADRERLRTALTSRAADVRGVLLRHEPEARAVLQALLADRLKFAPFNEGPTRGYQFAGTGTYGGLLLGDTCPTSHGGPNGIW
jgi:Recombinase zinc beta ribbon domain